MTKTITKVGNSQGIIFDAALMKLAKLKAGDYVNVELHDGGTVTLTPLSVRPSKQSGTRRRQATKAKPA